MEMKGRNIALKVVVAIAFLAMVVVNYLAQAIPINGVTPGEVSDSMPNLFAPVGLTFSIWGLIYLALAAFTVYQFGFANKTGSIAALDRVRLPFVLSSIANIAWIFAWHYGYIAWSMILMAALLLTLIQINLTLDGAHMSRAEKIMVRIPFSLYFGWITVATVANATALLVRLGWGGFGLTDRVWAVIILIVAMLIGTVTMVRRKDMTYGLVLIWAYVGILMKHTAADGFAGAYPAVIATVIACLAVYIAAEGFVVYGSFKHPVKA